MRRLLMIYLLSIWVVLPITIQAQAAGWCGYALIEGLPLLANQLAPFEAVTPEISKTVNPSVLFQYRFSLDHTKVIIEGCWKTDLTRDLAVTLLTQSVKFDPNLMANQVAAAIDQAVKTGAQVDAATVTRDYVDQTLVFSIFAPGGTREDSAAAARAYLQADSKAWDLPMP